MRELEVREIRPGLWRWMAPHPEWLPEKGGPGGWEQMVGCVYLETPDAIVLIDPLVPPPASAGREKFWAALDRDVERHGGPVEILLSNHYHARSAAEVLERCRQRAKGASLSAHADARSLLSLQLSRTFQDRERLPGGVEALGIPSLNPDEVAFWIPAHATIVFADAILGAGNDELRLAPASWADGADAGKARYDVGFRRDIAKIAALPVDIVLVSHGAPVLSGGRQALLRAIEAPAWGEGS